MVIDTSAMIAIFLEEPERGQFLEQIVQAETKLMSAVSVVEAGMVLESRRNESTGRDFDLFLVRGRIELVPVDDEQAEIARSAWRKYGKGRHPAALNLGDCFAYALAKSSGEKLLAKGEDFKLTDIDLI